MHAEIKTQAADAIENADLLVKQGIEQDNYTRMSRKDWEAALTSTFWTNWVLNLGFLVAGLLSTYMLYKDFRAWPFAIASLALSNLVITIPAMYDIARAFESAERFIAFWRTQNENDGGKSFYITFIWPVYFLPLLVLGAYTFIHRHRIK